MFKFKTLCIITGASRGLGKCIAVRFAQEFTDGSFIVLVGRTSSDLAGTKEKIENINPTLLVQTIAIDLSSCDTSILKQSLGDVFDEARKLSNNLEQIVIIHNAGSVGDVTKKQLDINDSNELQNYWNLSLTSVIALNSLVLNELCEHRDYKKLIVNISSLMALQPQPSMSLYCAAKAARDMLFRVLAAEDSSLRVLNYAPGPLKTAMAASLSNSFNECVKAIPTSDYILTCDQSVDKLIKLLNEDKFESGQHIDYFDL